jgi:hypothetical protein
VYSVIFTQATRKELIEAQDWYEGKATGLGRDARRRVGDFREFENFTARGGS